MGDPSGPPQPGQGTLAEHELRAAAAAEQLTTTQSIAQNWKNGLAGLLALVTTILFLKGPGAVDKIDRGYAKIVAVALGVSLIVAVVATWYALRASYGVPRRVTNAEIDDAGGLDAYRAHRADVALCDLRLARWLSLAAAGLFAAATVMFWFAPPAQRAFTYLEVRRVHGSPLCGRLTSAPPGKLAFVDKAGVTTIVAPADISALVAHRATDCSD
jgi:hypothetical protein